MLKLRFLFHRVLCPSKVSSLKASYCAEVTYHCQGIVPRLHVPKGRLPPGSTSTCVNVVYDCQRSGDYRLSFAKSPARAR